jgi:hypothetical protein
MCSRSRLCNVPPPAAVVIHKWPRYECAWQTDGPIGTFYSCLRIRIANNDPKYWPLNSKSALSELALLNAPPTQCSITEEILKDGKATFPTTFSALHAHRCRTPTDWHSQSKNQFSLGARYLCRFNNHVFFWTPRHHNDSTAGISDMMTLNINPLISFSWWTCQKLTSLGKQRF